MVRRSPLATGDRGRARGGRWTTDLLSVAIGAGAFALAFCIATGSVSPAEAGAMGAVALLAAGIIVGLRRPSLILAFARNVEAVKFLGTELSLRAVVQAATAQAPDTGPDEGSGVVSPTDLDGLRLDLEAKLAYVAKHLLPRNEQHIAGRDGIAYATIGRLRSDGYLTDADARLAMRLQTLPNGALEGMGAGDRRAFEDAAAALVGNLRFRVFAGMVHAAIGRAEEFHAIDLDDPKQRGFLVARTHSSPPTVLVQPCYSMRSRSALAGRAHRRAERALRGQHLEATVLVVVPVGSHATAGTEPDGVVTLDRLAERLATVLTGG